MVGILVYYIIIGNKLYVKCYALVSRCRKCLSISKRVLFILTNLSDTWNDIYGRVVE